MAIISWMSPDYPVDTYTGPPGNVVSGDRVDFGLLQPKHYEIAGTDLASKVLVLNVLILDATGRGPYNGDVLIVEICPRGNGSKQEHEKSRTLMPGMGDAHTHFTWNGGDLDWLGELGVEEYTLLTARSAKCYLDSGYPTCFGAASAKERLDAMIRDAINAGDIPSPRDLENGQEIARRGGELVDGITAFADDPEETRQMMRHHVDVGVNQIKLSMSGESTKPQPVLTKPMHGEKVCSHVRARDSVKQSIDYGVDVIHQGPYIDEEGTLAASVLRILSNGKRRYGLLGRIKSRQVVAPGINWMVVTRYDAGKFGYSTEKAEQAGYKVELSAAARAMQGMQRRGIVVQPGG